jgi:hypothetical protein
LPAVTIKQENFLIGREGKNRKKQNKKTKKTESVREKSNTDQAMP